ncbi:hypothetical protein [Pararhodobacter oceanensis]|uniref:hypothetical protein n=1 Tax=Pararhodobacter oceanensis TaxID=2172121 RepID=UPI003A906CA6
MRLISNAFFAATLIGAPFLASAASAQSCPSYGTSGSALSYDSDTVYSAQSHDLYAGGDIQLGNCDDIPGYGYIVESPDFTLQYDAQDRGRALEFRVEAECDAILLVNDSRGGWHFNDDDEVEGGGMILDPRLRLANAPSGQYDIWVGTLGEDICDATLYIESW